MMTLYRPVGYAAFFLTALLATTAGGQEYKIKLNPALEGRRHLHDQGRGRVPDDPGGDR